MGGYNGIEWWVSYASNDKEALKCIGLARSLKRTLTTRPLMVITSVQVGREMSFSLQNEVDKVYVLRSTENLKFRSLAKLKMYELIGGRGQRRHVFLDCNCLPVKNCDDLFRLSGVQWCGLNGTGEEFAGILVNSTSMRGVDMEKITRKVVERENLQGGHPEKSMSPVLEEIEYCFELDMQSPNPAQLPGNEIKMICFLNGHPNEELDEMGTVNKCVLTQDLKNFWNSIISTEEGNEKISQILRPTFTRQDPTCPIAIVGMACRYPGANSIKEFWNLLEQGLEGICKVPEGRWTKENSIILIENVRNTEAGFLSCPIDVFDAKFFNTNSADMALLDPQQRLSLRVVWEALEDAGIDPNSLKNSLTGVFGGWWRNDYRDIIQEVGVNDTDFLRCYMGNALGPLTARISHFFELIGPSFSTESGCSTSIAGVDMACDNLRNEACDVAIAVGVNLLLHPFTPGLLEGLLAPNGRCKTFDAGADGFGRAEGVGVLILKRLSSAVSDGDKIWGVIRSSAVVQEGTSRSMGTPTVNVEAKAMQLALDRAGIHPDDVDFVETHGTGTPIGDPIEVAAIAKAYSSPSRNPLIIGSVKTNVGHTESVCGITGIHKTVLAMQHNLIPKHLNFTQISPEIDLGAIPAQLPLEPIPWEKKTNGRPRVAGINSFGITGAQAHLILEEPPLLAPERIFTQTDSREYKIVTFSAKTESALNAQVAAYKDFLDPSNNVSLSNLEYTLHTGRPHFALRQVIVGSTNDELLSSIESIQKGQNISNTPPRLCFLFTGQGSQYAGMAKSLYNQSAVFASTFDWCDSILSLEYGVQIRKALWDDDYADLLNTTMYGQISIFCVEFCLLRLWESWGITPEAVMGHSLGEFVAAVAAEILNPMDALKMVVTRSKLIEALPSSGMLVVGCNMDTVLTEMNRAFANTKNWLEIAAVNSPNQTVVSGASHSIYEFKIFCDNNGIKTHALDASHGFHSKFMDPICQEYCELLSNTKFSTAKKYKFISGVEGRVLSEVDKNYWWRHTREKVCFLDASKAAEKEGLAMFLEIGPHPVLSALILTNLDEVSTEISAVPSLRRKADDWETMLSSLGRLYTHGIPINWKNFHRYSNRVKIEIPGYHFEDTSHWIAINDDGSLPFHPLLGGFVHNPSAVTIFRNSLNVNRIPFLKDHGVGDKILFPCAGYLDMCITAGYCAAECKNGVFTKPLTPLCLQNFAIHTPVCLSEMCPTEFQVTVDTSADGQRQMTIYTKLILEDKKCKWIRNASANLATAIPFSPDPALHDFTTIRARCGNAVSENNKYDYDELLEYGFNFGPSLRVVQDGWKNNSNDEFIFKFRTFETTDDLDRFIIHPWAVDPMLQTQLVALGHLNQNHHKRLAVPIQIESYIWWGPSNVYEGSGYVYIRNSSASALFESHLYNEKGKLMVSMIGTEYVETTLPNILALIDSHRNPYPTLAEVGWKEWLGPDERRIENQEIPGFREYENMSQPYDNLTEDEAQFHSDINKLAGLYIQKAIVELRLEANVWELSDVGEKCGVTPHLRKFLRYMFVELVKDGWLIQIEDNRFIRKKILPTLHQILKDIQILRSGMTTLPLPWVDTVWENLSQILTGKLEALPLLYPGHEMPGPAELFYKESLMFKKRAALNHVEYSILSRYASAGSKAVVRVLECGAGVGSSTSYLIDNMVTIGPSHFEYTYTDISPGFLEKGEKLFAETGIPAKFGVFNLEEDPFHQGLISGHYDIIVAFFVIHATRDIQEALINVRKLLKPGGTVLITELVNPNREVNLTFGGLSGFWKFADVALRPWNCELSISNWTKVLETCGFEDIVSLKSYVGANALLIGKLNSDSLKDCMPPCPRSDYWIVFSDECQISHEVIDKLHGMDFKVQVVTWDNRDDIETILGSASAGDDSKWVGVIYLWGLRDHATTEDVCKPYLSVCKRLAKLQSPLKLLTVTKGNLSTGATDFSQVNPISSPLIGMTNVLTNENPDIQCKCIDVDASTSSIELVAEMSMNDVDVVVVYRNRKRFTPRLRPYKIKTNCLSIPSSDRFQLVLPESRVISDLYFTPAKVEQFGPNEVEIEVKAYALNFLDIFMVTKPDPVFDKFNYLGVDIAGIVTKVGASCERKIGDRIAMARKTGCAMPSHLVTTEDLIIPIPDEMTMADAATFPMAALTATNCLLDAAIPKMEDVVLIHTASGGVGLMAIQMAQYIGCTIVATAGNDRKRNYLRSLGLKYIFNSRNTDYGKDIRNSLGRGVTIVLNSLTGPGYKEATLALCDSGARFIEMSKMNIWSKDEVKHLRPDVHYRVVDVSIIDEQKLKNQLKLIKSNLFGETDFKPKPLPYTRFFSSEVREALEYMEQVKHIGKIVLTMPELGNSGVGTHSFTLFNYCSTYLITGGLGGIGLEVAKWMASSGARNILLVGRCSPSPEALAKIAEIQGLEVNVFVELCDIGNPDDAERLFVHAAATMFPIRGIMHAAGVLDDGAWDKQSWEKYQNVFQAKVDGAWNLHQQSLKLHYPLEHFVLFSSMTATLGAISQSNYVAANQYLDCLSHYRYSQGQPAICINWGQWGEVGLAKNLTLPSFKPFTINQGLAALEHALGSRKIQVAAYDADLGSLMKVLNSTRGLLSEIEQRQANSLIEIDSDEFWKEYDVLQNNEERINVVKKFIKKLLRITLKMDKTEEIGDHVNFQDLGLDSLLMVELKNSLQSSFGKRVKISINSVKDCKTVAELSERLVELISGKEELPPPTREELKELISRDVDLPITIKVDNQLTSTPVPISQVECVLLLGVTGTLGSYMLIELLKQKSVKKIVCLLKHNPLQSSRERFLKCMSEKKLNSEIDMGKIEFVTGDVRKAKLGLHEFVHAKLVDEVHVIINLAVKVSFDEIYRETDDPRSSRVTNVFGMRNVLEFAVSGRLKYVYHSSSIVTEVRVGPSDRLWEEWVDEGLLESAPNSAYAISKLICDRLVGKAVENGIPCKIFRLPQIGGDSATGANVQIDSVLMMRFFAYMYLGIMPAQNIPFSLLPVDLCSKLSAQVFFDSNAGNEMFNLLNPHLGDERDFEELAGEFGVKMEALDPDEFVKRVEDMKQNEKLDADMMQLIQFAFTYKAEAYSLEDMEIPVYMSWIRGNKNIFLSEKLERLLPSEYPSCIPKSWDVLRKNLQHAKDMGLFDRFKIKYTKEN
ncbi:mycocerosic acid synthase-like polyketide synthase [Folsomia candida]|uniref:mycocerosic acid synthase-like polyketide synthase n=1 Tax=Folsomia candida TaxID=158441 RepID=UPI001604FAA4|nr:mycocerosic acid synthase-like polyketide synthase [Folsomia candida]